MSTTRRVLGVAAGAAGLAAGATVWRVAQRRRIIARRGIGDTTPFGSLRADPLTVVADLGGDLPEPGTEVVLFGPGDHGEPTAQEWAVACGTISYEIVTRMGGRLVRRYEGEQP